MTGQILKKRILPVLLVVFFICETFTYASRIEAAPKTLDIKQAISLAMSYNDDYEKVVNSIELAKTRYTQAIKKIRLKEKSQKTFRWTPVLNFKFPTSPSEQEAFEYSYSELKYQSEIDSLKHKLSDVEYAIHEKVETLFVDTYTMQEKIKVSNAELESAKKTLEKNQAKLLIGQATATDITRMENKIKKLESEIEANTRTFESDKKKLSDLINLEVTSNYTFVNPYITANLTRTIEAEAEEITLERDHSFYEKSVEVSNSLVALDTNYGLMKKKYGNKMSIIDSYVLQAKSGEKLRTAAFKRDYDQLLVNVDEPWTGKKRILFIKIPKVWFQGDTDGVRYVDDEPYVLYENAIEYSGLCAEKEALEKEIRQAISDNYDVYVSLKAGITETTRQIEEKEKEVEEALVKNLMGRLTYSEYADLKDEYEELQKDLIDQKASLSTTLYSFNRLTVGFLAPYFIGEEISFEGADGGESFVSVDAGDGLYYYIHELVAGNKFEIGLTKTNDYSLDITDFEFWINKTRIGERTPITRSIKHLKLDIEQVESCFIRLYNGNEFIDDCEIDPSVFSGRLGVTIGYVFDESADSRVGRFELTDNKTLGTMEIRLTPDAGKTEIKGYIIHTQDGKNFVGADVRPIDKPFNHLAVVGSSLENLIITFYDESGNALYDGAFNISDNTIHKIVQG